MYIPYTKVRFLRHESIGEKEGYIEAVDPTGVTLETWGFEDDEKKREYYKNGNYKVKKITLSQIIDNLIDYKEKYGDILFSSDITNTIKKIILKEDEINFVSNQSPHYIEINIPLDEFDYGDKKYRFIYPYIFNEDVPKLIMTINLITRKIHGWDELGVCSSGYIFEKVVDEGVYTLYNSNFEKLAQLYGYVPNGVLPPTDGYGDYIELQINRYGVVTNLYFYDKMNFRSFYGEDDE
jgi:hypothetical protein